MNVYDRLIQDHREVEQLFAKIIGTASPTERQSLCEELKTRIIAHDRAEEKIYYDAIEARQSVHDLVEDGRHDHQTVEHLLAEIDSIPADRDAWLDRVLEIQQKFLTHVREEEQQMFPKSREFLPPDKTEGMAEDFEHEERQLLSSQGSLH